jgi:hypothetical protein
VQPPVFEFTSVRRDAPAVGLVDNALNVRLKFKRKDTLQPSKRFVLSVMPQPAKDRLAERPIRWWRYS